MIVTTIEEWTEWRQMGCNMLPVLRRLQLPASTWKPSTWSGAWAAASEHAIVLESGKDGRYTYLGLRPETVIRGKGESAVIESCGRKNGAGDGVLARTAAAGKPLEVVRSWMAGRLGPRIADGPKWLGGLAGFWAYDIARSIERLPVLAEDDLDLPEYLFLELNELWILDHAASELICVRQTSIPAGTDNSSLQRLYGEAKAHTEAMLRIWEEIVTEAQSPRETERLAARQRMMAADNLQIDVEALQGLTSPFPKERYKAAVERIREYIGQGDVFQVNLSLRQSTPINAHPDELYEWLRVLNPSPYMGYLRCPDFQLVSASPELLVESRDGRLAARPIAGTRRRGRSPEEDLRMADELRVSEKERAEHIMLVDLMRNDLGRIAKYGTVRVTDLMVIEYYSHVMHLVSQVEGVLADGKDAYDVIAASFPGGTITGAPKIRTMEIIEELEPTRRGPYTGSLGWIDYNGDMEFNIIIRTMTVKDGSVHIQAGAGIVIDSDPEREYYESLNKAKALWKAIQYSEAWMASAAGQAGPSEEEQA
jgi:para-aminobenzoate synthetase component I